MTTRTRTTSPIPATRSRCISRVGRSWPRWHMRSGAGVPPIGAAASAAPIVVARRPLLAAEAQTSLFPIGGMVMARGSGAVWPARDRRLNPSLHPCEIRPLVCPVGAQTAGMAARATQRAGPAGSGLIRPMLATSGPVPSGPGWAFEVKFDGVRAIGYAGTSGLALYSRNDRDISCSYPEVAALPLEPGLVVDGELVALDGRGRPDFGLLQHRMHVAKPAADLIARVAVHYVVFDVLRRDDRSLLALPYRDRRGVLAVLGLAERGLVVPGNFTDTPGEVVMAAVAQQGLEGVVAKRLTSPYQPGLRSRAWVKTPIRHAAEVIIAGWSPSTGNGASSCGSSTMTMLCEKASATSSTCPTS